MSDLLSERLEKALEKRHPEMSPSGTYIEDANLIREAIASLRELEAVREAIRALLR